MQLEEFTRGITDVMQTQFLTMTAAGRQMSRQGSGVILAITATPAGRFVATNSGNFGVACAAIENLCRQLAGELGPRGVRVVCLARLARLMRLDWMRFSIAWPSGSACRGKRWRPIWRRAPCSSA